MHKFRGNNTCIIQDRTALYVSKFITIGLNTLVFFKQSLMLSKVRLFLNLIKIGLLYVLHFAMDYPVLLQQFISVVIKSQMTGYVVYLTIDVLPKNHKPTTQQNLSSIQKYILFRMGPKNQSSRKWLFRNTDALIM